MSVLTILQDQTKICVDFTGEVPLQTLLMRENLLPARPCGGRGTCGKCAVQLSGAVSAPNAQELALQMRLACQAVILGDAVVTLPAAHRFLQIETGTMFSGPALHPMPGQYGLAVDIGTTTLAAQLYDLHSGHVLAGAGLLNPQTQISADVMGRIRAAMDGQLEFLCRQIRSSIDLLLTQCCQLAAISANSVQSLVVTGNTTMLYLLSDRDPACLAHAPFHPDTSFGAEAALGQVRAYLPPCIDAFVGADITCAILASGMCQSGETALLCDIGTNGEIALWHRRKLYVTSTAAGPAFEGAGISCGCGSIAGAIDRVWLDHGALRIHTIADAPPVGLCGSGLIDAIAAFLECDAISLSGMSPAEGLALSEHIRLLPADVRAVQLAKAAIATGIQLLMLQAGIQEDDIHTLYLAGGFGSHLNLQSAASIGLLPTSLIPRTHVIGNAALTGAAQLLLDRTRRAAAEQLAVQAHPLNLSSHPKFNDVYVENMLFGNDDNE